MEQGNGWIDGVLCAWCKGGLPPHLAGCQMAMFCSRDCRGEWEATRTTNPRMSRARRHPAETPTASRRRASLLVPRSACTACGADTDTHVHHRDGNPMNNDLANLVRLCPGCHRRAHKAMAPRCSECDRPAKSRGYCLHHFRLWQKHGDALRSDYVQRSRTIHLSLQEAAYLAEKRCLTCGSTNTPGGRVYCPEHDVPWIGAAQKPKG